MREYNAGYLVGYAAGAIFGTVLIVVLLKFMKKDGSIKCIFDERQELIRGRGYKYGFYTLLIYNAFDIRFGATLEMYVDPIVIRFLGICLGVVVYGVYTVWHEGYIALNENSQRVKIAFAVIALVNIVISICHIMHGDVLENGRVGIGIINLICGVAVLIILLAILIKNACTKESDER